MTTVLAQILDPHFIGTILRVATPLLLAALGVMISDRAGVLNIGMEGMMLVAALIAVLASAATGSPAVGLLAALVVGALLGWLMSLSVNRLGTDLIMTGIALNIAAAAATTLGLYLATGDKGMSGALKSGALAKPCRAFHRQYPCADLCRPSGGSGGQPFDDAHPLRPASARHRR